MFSFNRKLLITTAATCSLLAHDIVYGDNGTTPVYTKQIKSSIFSNQRNISPTTDPFVSSIHIGRYNANDPSEDEYSIMVDGSKGSFTGYGSLFGIFDGHSGGYASAYCKKYLFSILQHIFTSDIKEGSNLDSLIPKNMDKEQLSAFLKATFVITDDAFLSGYLATGQAHKGQAGACAIVSHISRDGVVTTANAGDCRSIIGRLNEQGQKNNVIFHDSNDNSRMYQHVDLSNDAEIGCNPNERDRLLSNHINERDIIRRDRVKGRLQPTRGLGDGTYKRIEYYENRSYEFQQKYNIWKPPYTTAVPEISTYKLSNNDKFMVMSTDGLFQDLSSKQVVQYVEDYLTEYPEFSSIQNSGFMKKLFRVGTTNEVPNCGSYLIAKSLKTATESVIGRTRRGYQNDMGEILKLPPGKDRRRIHDDHTVVVVFFKDNVFDNNNDNTPKKTHNVSLPREIMQTIGQYMK